MNRKNICEICTLIMGQSPDSKSYNKDKNGIPFYQGNADFGEEHPTPTVWCTAPKKIARKGDILISVRAPIGDMNIANEDCCIGRGLAAIRLNKSDIVDINYLYHYLSATVEFLQEQGTGSTFKAILNNDFSTYMLVKSDYEPIITEEEWYRCQEIKQRRVTKTIGVSTDGKKKQPNHGKNETKDLWATKLKCRCGASFRRNRWHKNNNAPWSYGYLCYNRLNNGSAQKRRDAGLDDTGYCDQTEIPDWKLEMMGKMIMEQVWRTRAEDIKLACKILNECYKPDIKAPRQNKSVMLANIEKLKSKKDNLLDMRSDGEITKEEFLNKKEEIDKKISQLTAEYEKDDCPTESDEAGLELSKIEAALNELIDFSQPVLPREIYQKFVSKVTPYSKTHYRWYLNLDGTGTQTADVKVNGRKSNAAVAFCDEGEIPPVHFKEIIFFNILKQEIINKKSFFVATLHRLPSANSANKKLTQQRRQNN